jgi:Cu+-exporting ATPase
VNITPQVRTGAVPSAEPDDAEPSRADAYEEDSITHHDHAVASDVVDPVCGMSITPAGAAATREVGGMTYYFCSQQRTNAFDADPER